MKPVPNNNQSDNENSYASLRMAILYLLSHFYVLVRKTPLGPKPFVFGSAASLVLVGVPVAFVAATADSTASVVNSAYDDASKLQATASHNNSNFRASVKVNGQPIPVPANGTVSQTFTDNSQTTSVKVQSHTSQESISGDSVHELHTSVQTSVNSSSNEQGGMAKEEQ